MTDLIGVIETGAELGGAIGTETELGSMSIPAGPRGEKGEQGLSAYEVWLAEGNVGTIEDFLDSLALSGVSYEVLEGKPRIEQVELVGNRTFEELGAKAITEAEIANLF